MKNLTAFLDANVLYPAPLRDFLIRLARAGMFRAKWTSEVHQEWMSALLRNQSNLNRSDLKRTRMLMNTAVPNCLVKGYRARISTLNLPDPNDRHVLAAAIKCRADVIVTRNLRHFPASALGKYRIQAQSPDDFIMGLIESDLDLVVKTAKEQRVDLKKPPVTVQEYLDTLKRNGLTQVVAELRNHRSNL